MRDCLLSFLQIYNNMKYKRIDSRSNPVITECTKLNMKKYREQSCLFYTEGRKLANEAARAGLKAVKVIVEENFYNENVNFCSELELKFGDETEYFVTNEDNIRKISEQNSPEGIICVFGYIDKIKKIDKINTSMHEKTPHTSDGCAMVFDSLRDPGNLGTVIRSALAFGIDEVFLSPDCTDLYSLKTLRGSMGAVFYQKITVCPTSCAIEYLKNTGRSVYAAALHTRSLLLNELDVTPHTAFVIGNEANGLPDSIIEQCDGCALIPMGENSESLNASVAASVFMWELKKSK